MAAIHLISSPPKAAGPTTYLFDNFTGTNGTSVNGRTPTTGSGTWTNDNTGSGLPSLLISSNRARCDETVMTASYVVAGNFFDVAQTQFTAKLKVKPGNRDIGLLVRTTRAYNDPGIQFTARSGGDFRITNYGVAVLYTGGSHTTDESTEYELKVVIGASNAFNFYVDNSSVYSGTITDYSTRTLVGAYIQGDGGGVANTGGSMDDVSVTA